MSRYAVGLLVAALVAAVITGAIGIAAIAYSAITR